MRATKACKPRMTADLKLTEHRQIAVADPPVVPRQTQREAVARETVLRLVNVSKRFAAMHSIDGVSSEVKRGVSLGVTGRSGA